MGSVNVRENCFPQELLNKIEQFSYTVPRVKTNLINWDPSVVGHSGAILILPVEDDLLNAEIKTAAVAAWPELSEFVDHEWEMAYTIGSWMSYIPWHSDKGHIYAITVYLSPHWDNNWAGYFVYDLEDGTGLHAVMPGYNRGLLLTPPVWHTTTVPNIQAAKRLSLQIFVRSDDSDAAGY